MSIDTSVATGIDAPFIQRLARDIYAIEVAAPRAAELAVEAERLDAAVRRAAVALDFDTLPAAHVELLRAGERTGSDS